MMRFGGDVEGGWKGGVCGWEIRRRRRKTWSGEC